MFKEVYFTEYAPAERAPLEEIARQTAFFEADGLLDSFASTVNEFVLILNTGRQAVYANELLINYLNSGKDEVLGKRPGEMLDCVNAAKAPGGCGTSRFCRTCGAVNAILNSADGKRDMQECHIQQKSSGSSLNLRIKTNPLRIYGEDFIIAAFSDISDEKRRRSLERIFFHDLLNIACGLNGLTELMNLDKSPHLDKYKHRLTSLTRRFTDEIELQRDLNAAENNELFVSSEVISSLGLLSDVAEICQDLSIPGQKTIKIAEDIPHLYFTSDRILLGRVLINLVKNALEATEINGTVTLSSECLDDKIVFHVHNTSFIPEDIQLQIFQRSFSTKGSGRGLGTYSARLLSERYLQGSVSFTSSKDKGTLFTCIFPLRLS